MAQGAGEEREDAGCECGQRARKLSWAGETAQSDGSGDKSTMLKQKDLSSPRLHMKTFGSNTVHLQFQTLVGMGWR